MGKSAFFLFPGQGAQYRGMGIDLLETGMPAVKRLFELASDISGIGMEAMLKEADDETLKRTDISQIGITLADLAAAAYLAEKGIGPVGAAGFSLGEYAALVTAGVIGCEDCFRLVMERGRAMQAAVERLQRERGGAGMTAVIGLEPEKVESLAADWQRDGLRDLYVANINSPRQTVVSGTAAALGECEKRFAQAGAAMTLPLATSGPFHSPLMAEAAEAFRPALEKTAFNDPRAPVYSNVTGKRIFTGAEAKQLALEHITRPVRWTKEEAAIQAAGGFDLCLETGPGRTLRGLWKDTGFPIKCLGAGTAAEIDRLEKET
jgi:[acyl-carrier-protein] S-malonyltransferase